MRIQLNNTKHFCAQSGGSIRLTIWKWGSGELGYPGALPPMLEDSCCTFSPGPTDSSWVSKDSVHLAWMLKHTVHFWKSVMWELCWVAGTKVPQINTKLIFLKANSKLLTFFFPKHTQILQSELSFAPFTSGMWIHLSTSLQAVCFFFLSPSRKEKEQRNQIKSGYFIGLFTQSLTHFNRKRLIFVKAKISKNSKILLLITFQPSLVSKAYTVSIREVLKLYYSVQRSSSPIPSNTSFVVMAAPLLAGGSFCLVTWALPCQEIFKNYNSQ